MVVYTDTSKEFQSTPPRRRRPQLAASQASQNISIHASAKEATKSTTATTAAKKISIHASAKEATVYNGTIDWKKVKFQSTPPRRRRLFLDIIVTIVYNYFNPRLREGGDFKPCTPSLSTLFQSTPPRRRRLEAIANSLEHIDFNPRLREGGDIPDEYMTCTVSFQSTPPRRRRRYEKYQCYIAINFNPRLREGGDTDQAALGRALAISIHASAKEATTIRRAERCINIDFNPRLREGGD